MRRIINSKAYDAETASLIASGNYDSALSQAMWSLYRTNAGAWFEVAADHDGVVDLLSRCLRPKRASGWSKMQITF
jgi:hypothetical protein